MITDIQKEIIDFWQAKNPEKFPRKPAPKVYLTPSNVREAVIIAKENGYNEGDINAAMWNWRHGFRYREAIKAYHKKTEEARLRTKERSLEILGMLKLDFPLFNDDVETKPLKIGIHKDLTPWAAHNFVSEAELGKALRVYVKRAAYRKALGYAIKNEGKRYGLDGREYDLNERPCQEEGEVASATPA